MNKNYFTKYMKTYTVVLISVLTISYHHLSGQSYNPTLDAYTYHKNNLSPPAENPNLYKNIDGNPYLKREFIDGIIYLKDTSAFKMPLRYNIYADKMEYQMDGVNYEVGNPESLNKIEIDGSLFLYLPFIKKGGYFELLESGKCLLVQKRSVSFNPAEGAKPIIATPSPAEFKSEPDIFYLIINDSKSFEITNMKSVINALQDQKPNIEGFIEREKLRKPKKDNLRKIAVYYNSL
jgi:hypothetical protein